MFRQLSFDTSKSDVHIALIDDQSVISEYVAVVADATSGNSRQEAANLLIPEIDRMMSDVGWKKSDIDCIIVGTGPGGFTGIRTSVVTARALAQALHLPLYPVSLLECIASSLPGSFTIALYATAGHYFLARGTAAGVECAYVKQRDVAVFAHDFTRVHADARALAEFSNEEPIVFASRVEIKELPPISNVAAQQSRFAWQGLSLKVGEIYEKLGGLNAASGTPSESLKQNLRAELRQQFPYDSVVPTYLRAPSVTLKKTNV
jgi:tRNA threonylcarbamoyl adenosine modification protein YeaZ